ncbi:succinate dehydrogenase, cytochrome b556 subunit [Candidatus Pandoraea novymonadis]|uniref:Succinate dehydrogenase cytochrome b556 subunit n=1 Tax=Candidatus Pandoraea novymonadis TaxID=1808959 RepID=A0ABX5FFA6_9BURK|nr:succinate dehydrogenase, cytochrome b556 subunit [Candidatus Pandoraea novymonadis]PSB92158.1 Succinate dehydrogenase cytochrome b556 subunit [Candidatus Pandoraea novymonadis]
MAEAVKKERPVHKNIGIGQIITYRLPPAGIVSILHRISGALMFLLLPFFLYLFEQSLTSELSFDVMHDIVANSFVKLMILLFSWGFLHHFLAGLRHLCMDMNHEKISKEGGKRSAVLVLFFSLILTASVALKLFGVF